MSVTILERMGETGKKILMSGGTRANVLPAHISVEGDFFTNSGSLTPVKRLLASFPLDAQRSWLSESVGIPLRLEEQISGSSAKWFPASGTSRSVRDALLHACRTRGVAVQHNASVEQLTPRAGGGWTAHLKDGSKRSGDTVVLSTGGLSFPAVGTDGTGHRIAASLGHVVERPFPALVPLYGPHPGGGPGDLAGVSLQTVALRCGGAKGAKAARSGFLFTHRGFSGPAVLDLSHRFVPGGAPTAPSSLLADWTGEGRAAWEGRLAEGGAALVSTRLSAAMPARLAAALCAAAGVPAERKAAELRREERVALLDALTAYPLHVTGDAGFPKAEVSGGGVPLSELSSNSLESKRSPGLFLCGEIVDVFGRIGGYNFSWAWASGRLAGLGAASSAARTNLAT